MIEYASNREPLKLIAETGGVLAVITAVDGTSYRNLGTMMAFGPDGKRVGSLSSGCIEDDIAEHAKTARASGKCQALRYGAGSPFFDLKLPCGGGLSILLIPNPDQGVLQSILAKGAARQNVVVALNLSNGDLSLLTDVGDVPGQLVLTFEPELRFWVYGHGVEAIAFALMAQAAGYDVTLFGQNNLQSDLSRLGPLPIVSVASFRSHICPDPDHRTAVTLFFHDHENEAILLSQLLGSAAFYVGAQGSLRARQKLLADLSALGVGPAAQSHLRPDFGLIPSCRDPRTLAVSVLAHVLAVAADGSAET